MRIFKHRSFDQWARSEHIADSVLKRAVNEMENGLFDGNLGSGLYKKRVPMSGKGKQGSYRTFLAFRRESRIIFIYGFAKNERDNIGIKEEKIYRRLARHYLDMDEGAINSMLNKKILYEVKGHEKNAS